MQDTLESAAHIGKNAVRQGNGVACLDNNAKDQKFYLRQSVGGPSVLRFRSVFAWNVDALEKEFLRQEPGRL